MDTFRVSKSMQSFRTTRFSRRATVIERDTDILPSMIDDFTPFSHPAYPECVPLPPCIHLDETLHIPQFP
jgi:hypothetical protein